MTRKSNTKQKSPLGVPQIKREADPSWLSRNAGFVSSAQQHKLNESTIAIAGLGGVGGRIATELTRLGAGHLKLADPDIFTITNLNRQEGSFQSTVGKPKAEVVASLCRDINPEIEIEIYGSGITDSNIVKFVESCDLVVEATDFTLPHLGVQLARLARSNGIPLVMGVEIGFGATVAWFAPAGYKYERYLGLSTDVAAHDIESGKQKVDLSRWLPHIPNYGDVKVLRAVSEGRIEAPAIAPAVDLCSSLASTLVLGLLVGYRVQPPAPAVLHFDAKERASRLIRNPYLHHYYSLLLLLVRNALRLYDHMDLN